MQVDRELNLLYSDLDSAIESISVLMRRAEDAERRLDTMRGEVREEAMRLIQSMDPDERRIGWQLAMRFGMAKEVSLDE